MLILAVAPVGDFSPGGALGAILVAILCLGTALTVALVSRRRNRSGGPMDASEQRRVDTNRSRNKSLIKYYLWVAAIAAVGLVVVGILALMN